MEPREIPGFYYDPDKKKYFKIARNAPPSAAYSAESVKRRKLEHEKQGKARLAAANRKRLVQRSPVLQHPLTGGFLATEYGNASKDFPAACFAIGLCYKGAFDVSDASFGRHRDRTPIEHLYVSNALHEGSLGSAIASFGESEIRIAYIPQDEHDRVSWDPSSPFSWRKPRSQGSVPQISSIKYHAPTDKILITSREPGEQVGLFCLSPSFPGDNTSPELYHMHDGPPRRKRFQRRVTNTCAPAPPGGSSIVCVVGTSRGLGCLSGNGEILWHENLSSSVSAAHLKAGPPPASDVLSVDFIPDTPHLVVAGLRGSQKICLGDLRQPSREWEWLSHRSSPAHVRCLNEHHVLAAGANHSMSIYDLRFRHRKTYRNSPVVIFPEFRNDEQIHFGLDVDTSLGIVATGDSSPSRAPGRDVVSLFSLETGKRLQVPALRDRDYELAGKALMFQTLPHETNASLFVGGSSGNVLKFSFGGEIDEWTGERFSPPGLRP